MPTMLSLLTVTDSRGTDPMGRVVSAPETGPAKITSDMAAAATDLLDPLTLGVAPYPSCGAG